MFIPINFNFTRNSLVRYCVPLCSNIRKYLTLIIVKLYPKMCNNRYIRRMTKIMTQNETKGTGHLLRGMRILESTRTSHTCTIDNSFFFVASSLRSLHHLCV